ncbi:hypothetical protein VTO42DRAFT_4035 [Malbranchea cinnamomea]
MLLKRFVVDAFRKRYTAGSVLSTLVEFCIRFLQFVFGIAVIGLYAQDLVRTQKAGDGMDPEWLYATITGTIAAFSSLVYIVLPCIVGRPVVLLPFLHLPALVHDSILCILWLTLFGIFAKKYITADEINNDVTRMKNAVWIDLINLSFWIITAVWCGLRWNKSRKGANRDEKIQEQSVGEV